MPSNITQPFDNAWVIADLFSPGRCQGLIDWAERKGFEPATVRVDRDNINARQMKTHVRNNDRLEIRSPEIAGQMWQAVQECLPDLDNNQPTGVDVNIRFYRYHPGQRFKRHRDGSVTNAHGETSRLSYLIFLNQDFLGGETQFLEYIGQGRDRTKQYHTIIPATGTALLFRHECWHQGNEVKEGIKYILRTDVFYSNKNP